MSDLELKLFDQTRKGAIYQLSSNTFPELVYVLNIKSNNEVVKVFRDFSEAKATLLKASQSNSLDSIENMPTLCKLKIDGEDVSLTIPPLPMEKLTLERTQAPSTDQAAALGCESDVLDHKTLPMKPYD